MTIRRVTEQVSTEEAAERLRKAWGHSREVYRPSHAANVIWPGHKMKGQGAGFAAARVLQRLEKLGYVSERYDEHDNFGWFWKGK